MAQETLDFSVIKQKIIKTDELLRKYQETNNKLKKVALAYREVKLKHEQAVLNITRIEIEKERCNFTLENMKLSHNVLQNENKELRDQKCMLEDKYNHQSIQCQLEIQKLQDELVSLQMANVNSNKRRDKDDNKKVKALEEQVKKLKDSEATYKKEIEDLISKNDKLLRDINSFKEQKLKRLAMIETENKDLINQIAELEHKVKEQKSEKSNDNKIEMRNVNDDKDMKINELNRKIFLLTMDTNKVKMLEEENERLKHQLMSQELDFFSSSENVVKSDSSTQTDIVPNDKPSTDHMEKQREKEHNEIISLRKKIACLTMDREKFGNMEKENETLKQKLLAQEITLMEIKEKKSSSDFAVQANMFEENKKKSTSIQTLEDMRIHEAREENANLKQLLVDYEVEIKVLQEKLENNSIASATNVSHTEKQDDIETISHTVEDISQDVGDISDIEDNIEDILNEMRAPLPRILSPMLSRRSPASCNDTDIILSPILSPVDTRRNLGPPLNIPQVVVTPPTPTVESAASFKDIEDNLKTSTVSLETTEDQLKSDMCSNESSYSKNIRRKKYRSPFLSSEFAKLTNKFHKRPFILNRMAFKKGIKKAKKLRSQDCVLKALQTLKRSKINFTISNESILPKCWLSNACLNDYPLMYNSNALPTKVTRPKTFVAPRNYKNAKRLTEHLVCNFSSCDKNNGYMLLNKRNELLGFFNVKDETITPSGSRIGNVTEQKPFDFLETLNLNMKNPDSFLETLAEMVSKKLKQKEELDSRTSISNETFESFSSETEPELERLLDKPREDILKRNKSPLQQAQQNQTTKMDKNDISDIFVPQDTNRNNINAKDVMTEDSCDSMKFSTCPDLLSPMSSISKIIETPPSKKKFTIPTDSEKHSTYFEPNFDIISKITPIKKIEQDTITFTKTDQKSESDPEIEHHNITPCFKNLSSSSAVSITSNEDVQTPSVLHLKSFWESPAKTPNKSTKNNLEILSPNGIDVSFLEREYSLLEDSVFISSLNFSQINRSILFDEEVQEKKFSSTEDVSYQDDRCSLDAPLSPIEEDFEHVDPIEIPLEKSPAKYIEKDKERILKSDIFPSDQTIQRDKSIDSIDDSNYSSLLIVGLENPCESNISDGSGHEENGITNSVDDSCHMLSSDNLDGPLSPVQEEINHVNPVIIPLEKTSIRNIDDEGIIKDCNSFTQRETDNSVHNSPISPINKRIGSETIPLDVSVENDKSSENIVNDELLIDCPQSPAQEEVNQINPIIIPLDKSSENDTNDEGNLGSPISNPSPNEEKSSTVEKCVADQIVTPKSNEESNSIKSQKPLKDDKSINEDTTNKEFTVIYMNLSYGNRSKLKTKQEKVHGGTETSESPSLYERDKIGAVEDINKYFFSEVHSKEADGNSLTNDILDALKCVEMENEDEDLKTGYFDNIVSDLNSLEDLRTSKAFSEDSRSHETISLPFVENSSQLENDISETNQSDNTPKADLKVSNETHHAENSSQLENDISETNESDTPKADLKVSRKRKSSNRSPTIRRSVRNLEKKKKLLESSENGDDKECACITNDTDKQESESSFNPKESKELVTSQKYLKVSNETHHAENSSQLENDISETNESDTPKADLKVSRKRKSSNRSPTIRRSVRNLEKKKKLLKSSENGDDKECACITNDTDKQESESSFNPKESKELVTSQPSDSKNESPEMVIQVKRKRGRPMKTITKIAEPSEVQNQSYSEVCTQTDTECESLPIEKKKDMEENLPSDKIESEDSEEIKVVCDTEDETIPQKNIPVIPKPTKVKKRRNMTKLKSTILKQFREKRKMFQTNVENANFVNFPICDVPKPDLELEQTNVNIGSSDSTTKEECATNVCDVIHKSEDKKINIVQNIMIPPNSNFAIDLMGNYMNSECDIRLEMPSSSRGSINVNDSAHQDNKVEENDNIPPKKKKVSRAKKKTSDVLSKIMDEMSRGKPISVAPSKPAKVKEGFPPSIVEKEWRKNILDIAEITYNVAEDDVNLLICNKNSHNFVKSPSGISAEKVKLLLFRLMKLSSEDKIAEEVLLEFKRLEVDQIAEIILHKVSQDIVDKEDDKYYPAPLMTITQRTLLNLMVQLENENVENLIETFLTKAETFLFQITCGLRMVTPLTRLYVAVCRLLGKVNRVRRMCCNAFLLMGDLAIPLLFTVLTSWSEILPMESDLKFYPMTKILVHIIHLKGCNTNGYNLFPLKMLLHQYYGYPKEKWNCHELFQEWYHQYLKNPGATTEVALRLLCKNKDSKWVYKKVNEFFKPLFYKIPEHNVNFKATVILLISKICRSFKPNEEVDETYLADLQRWLISLTEGENIPDIIERSVDLSLRVLPKKRPKRLRAAKTVTRVQQRKKGGKCKQLKRNKLN